MLNNVPSENLFHGYVIQRTPITVPANRSALKPDDRHDIC
jgi:hypothetical protein